jgi:sec-independent protein translocase protein TatC
LGKSIRRAHFRRDDLATIAASADRASEKRMSFFEHLEELRQRFKVVIVVVLVFFGLFLTTAVGTVDLGSTRIPMLVPAFGPGQSPVANQFFLWMKSYLVPSQVGGINVSFTFRQPWDGVVVQVKTAFFLALIFAFPFIAYEFGEFIGPALKPSEKRLILRVTLPVVVLFFAGVLLCFIVVLPFTFSLLYTYQTTLGANLLLLFADDFISFVLLFLIGFGLAFELPILMYGLSVIGLVKAEFWKKYWRFAAIAIFVFGALITPDGSGVTMMLVSVPMLVLYVLGYAFSARYEKRQRRTQSS